ncbi:MAG: flavin reductase family protein [Bacteroidota bacterium]
MSSQSESSPLPDQLIQFMRHVPSPVMVVTAMGPEGARGMTAGSFTSVSKTPPLISFNVQKESQMYSAITTTKYFAVHLLAEDQALFSNHFATPGLTSEQQFAEIAHHIHETGVPVMDGTMGALVCKPYALHEAGDHVLVLGEVVDVVDGREGKPLVYQNRAYRQLVEPAE